MISKDHFDEGSISYDDEKGGIHQEDSVLSDSAVIVEGEEALESHQSIDGDDIDDDDEDEDNYRSKPGKSKVFEFSGNFICFMIHQSTIN